MRITEDNVMTSSKRTGRIPNTIINDREWEASDENGFVSSHPGAVALAAAAMLSSPVLGFGATAAQGNAAELPDDSSMKAKIVQNENAESETTEEVKKDVGFSITGPGHIEAVSNCEIENGTIHFTDPNENATFKIVKDVDGAQVTMRTGDTELQSDSDTIELEAHSDYDLSFEFVDVMAQQEAEEQAKAAAAAAQAQEASAHQQSSNGTVARAQARTSTNNARQSTATKQMASTPVTTNNNVQSSHASTVQQSSSTPNSGAAQNSMTSEENAIAHEIFDAYNSYRTSKGLSAVSWSDDCANMAYGSATGCAARGSLVHRLGIPSGVQNHYSDILQYSTWRMSGTEAVQKWQNSTGHRKMMQCESASVAGVGVFKSGNYYYYAIVYNFSGTNQSGA